MYPLGIDYLTLRNKLYRLEIEWTEFVNRIDIVYKSNRYRLEIELVSLKNRLYILNRKYIVLTVFSNGKDIV